MIKIHKNWEGVDINQEISLFEYGILTKENADRTFTVIQCVNAGGMKPTTKEDLGGMEWHRFTSSMEELLETTNESWFDKDAFVSFTGVKMEEYTSFIGLCFDMIQYYGTENVFGGDGFIHYKSVIELLKVGSGIPKVTDLECQVLKNVCTSDYGDGYTPQERVKVQIWGWSATDSRKDLVGALGSCVKKGLCGSNGEKGNDATVWLTKLGADYLDSINFKF